MKKEELLYMIGWGVAVMLLGMAIIDACHSNWQHCFCNGMYFGCWMLWLPTMKRNIKLSKRCRELEKLIYEWMTKDTNEKQE